MVAKISLHTTTTTTTAKKLRQLISCLQMYWHAQPVDAKSHASKMGYFGKHILFHFHTATLLDFIQVKLTLAGLDLALTMDRCAAVSCSFLFLLSFLYIWYYTKCGRKALFQSLIGKTPNVFLYYYQVTYYLGQYIQPSDTLIGMIIRSVYLPFASALTTAMDNMSLIFHLQIRHVF